MYTYAEIEILKQFIHQSEIRLFTCTNGTSTSATGNRVLATFPALGICLTYIWQFWDDSLYQPLFDGHEHY